MGLKKGIPMRRLFAALALVTFGLAARRRRGGGRVHPAYHSVIEVAKDGTLTVTETITATCRRQPYPARHHRDFPLTFVDERGGRSKVDFIFSRSSGTATKRNTATSRSAAASASIREAPTCSCRMANNTFQITYETSRQIASSTTTTSSTGT